MPTVDVVDLTNEKVDELELADGVFGVMVNESLLHQAVTAHRAAGRAGTHHTKRRKEVSGSGRKLWRQEGTGRARIGSVRSALWRGGATTHGPRPRSYEQTLPRKMFLGALRSALTARLNDGAVTVVRDFMLDDHKTKTFGGVLTALGADGRKAKVLVVENEDNINLERSSRNIPGVTLIASRELDPYSVLGHDRILISAAAARKCCEALA